MVQLLKSRKRSVKAPEAPPPPVTAELPGPVPVEERTERRENEPRVREQNTRGGNIFGAYRPVVSRVAKKSTGSAALAVTPRLGVSVAGTSKADKSNEPTSAGIDHDDDPDSSSTEDELFPVESTIKSKPKATPTTSVSSRNLSKKDAPAPQISRRVSSDEEMEVDDEIDTRRKTRSRSTTGSGEGTSSKPVPTRKPSVSTSIPEPLTRPSAASKSKQQTPVTVGEGFSSDDDDEFLADKGAHPQATASTCVSSSSKSSASLSLSRVRNENMDVDEEHESSPSILTSSKDGRRSSLGSKRSRDRISTASSSIQGSESGLSEYSFDPNDPDWLKFSKVVAEDLENAYKRLSSDLIESSNSLALFGKLVCRSMAGNHGEDSNKLRDKYGFSIIRAILYLTIENENRSGVVLDLVNMLFSELKHFSTPVLYQISEYCLGHMKKDKGCLPSRWVEIFGKVISVLITRGDIKHETDILEGAAYKEYIIAEICSPRLNWTPENTASLLAIIREIPGLDDTELKLLFYRLRSFLKSVKPAALPPIVHQLILLAGNRCPSELLTFCAEYFENINFNNSEVLEIRQKRNALGTVVFHFMEAARHSDSLLKAVIKIVKASFFEFGKVMSPFLLSVVLGLTTYEHAKAMIIDPLRNSIMKSFHSLHLSEMSYWYRHKIGDAKDNVTECFKSLLDTKSSELEFMVDGLRELGIGLLNADLYQNKYPNTLERSQTLGSYLITSILKSFPDQLPNMMKHLIKVSSRSLVHTECLAKCIEMRTRQLIHPSMLGTTCEIIRQLPLMESTSAAMIVKALSNAFNLSYILLDQLMLHLRKTIWKSVEARRTAAKTMIILLSNSRVVGEVPFSQFSESQRFYTQSQNNQSSSSNGGSGQIPDNQPLCIEVLTLAKRCFSQQCEIREELYLGFHSVVRKNPGLCELICSHLHSHTNQYFSGGLDNEDTTPSILFGKVVDLPASTSTTTYSTATIKEELGFLVQCLSFVVHKSHQAFRSVNDGPPHAVAQLEELLQKWIKAVLNITPTSIEIAAADEVTGAGGGSRPLDTVRYVETIFTIQIMQVIEALIEFLNLENKPRNERLVKKLFERYNMIEPLLKKEKEKSTNKKGKGDKDKTKGKKSQKGGKDKDATVADLTIADTASECSENPAAGVKFKKPDAPKRLFYFSLTLESTLDMLRKLQKSDDDKGAMSMIESEEFEKFLLSLVKQKFTSFKRKESLHERSRPTPKILEIFADIAGCIWNGLLMHNSEEEDGLQSVPVEIMESRLEIVSDIVTLLCSSHLTHCRHLIKIFSDDDSENSYDEVFPKFFNSWKAVHGWMPATANVEGDKAVFQYLFDILTAFAKPLSPDSEENIRAIEVLNWVWNYMASSSGKTGEADFLLADSVVSCWLTYYMKGKDFLQQPGKRHHDVLTLAIGVKQALGIGDEVDTQYLDDNETSKVDMWIINEDTAPTVLCAIMNQMEMILDHIMAVLGKLKYNQSDDTDTQNKIGLLRGCCFTKIDEIVTVCSQIVVSRFPACLCCATMLKVIPQIFLVMTGFGEYFFDLIKSKRPYSLKGFAKPVAKIGKNFKPLVEGMINHVERVQREYVEEVLQKAIANKKSKSAAKVPQAVKNQLLKEKKLIPNFVYVIERYDHLIIALSKKSDIHKLLVGMKLSTARDFRIDSKKLTEAMNSRVRSVQEMETVPDEESNMEALNNTTTAGPSRPRTTSRQRKARKRKSSERDEENEQAETDE